MQKLPKGSLIRVEGKLRSREWTEKATGDKRKAFAVVATALQRVRAAEPSAFPQQSYYSSNYQAGVRSWPGPLSATSALLSGEEVGPSLPAGEGRDRWISRGGVVIDGGGMKDGRLTSITSLGGWRWRTRP